MLTAILVILPVCGAEYMSAQLPTMRKALLQKTGILGES